MLFTIMNNKDTILQQLRLIGLPHHEALLYIELLNGPATHMRLAHATGINRTKIYRLAQELEKRSLISRRTDDSGTFLVAADPSTLEVGVVTAEEHIKQRREALDTIMPTLHSLKQGAGNEFIVNTYEGVEGFKQMLWHELKAEKECLVFGSGIMEQLVPDHRWTEKHRSMTVEAGYRVRELLNPDSKAETFTDNPSFMRQYDKRCIPTEILPLQQQMAIYNDTVATYHWRKEQKVGFEVVSKSYATMMRSVFDHYWQLAA